MGTWWEWCWPGCSTILQRVTLVVWGPQGLGQPCTRGLSGEKHMHFPREHKPADRGASMCSTLGYSCPKTFPGITYTFCGPCFFTHSCHLQNHSISGSPHSQARSSQVFHSALTSTFAPQAAQVAQHPTDPCPLSRRYPHSSFLSPSLMTPCGILLLHRVPQLFICLVTGTFIYGELVQGKCFGRYFSRVFRGYLGIL